MARIKSDLAYGFIHPAWRGAWCWDRVLEIMHSWGRKAYAVNCPGHGTRINEMAMATLADYPKAVIEFINQHRPDRVVLVGNSTGGSAAAARPGARALDAGHEGGGADR